MGQSAPSGNKQDTKSLAAPEQKTSKGNCFQMAQEKPHEDPCRTQNSGMIGHDRPFLTTTDDAACVAEKLLNVSLQQTMKKEEAMHIEEVSKNLRNRIRISIGG